MFIAEPNTLRFIPQPGRTIPANIIAANYTASLENKVKATLGNTRQEAIDRLKQDVLLLVVMTVWATGEKGVFPIQTSDFNFNYYPGEIHDNRIPFREQCLGYTFPYVDPLTYTDQLCDRLQAGEKTTLYPAFQTVFGG